MLGQTGRWCATSRNAQRAPDTALRGRLRDLANERRRFGYRRLFVLLRRKGELSGINRIYRLYREEGLTVHKRKAHRKALGTRAPILIEACPMPAGPSTLAMGLGPVAASWFDA